MYQIKKKKNTIVYMGSMNKVLCIKYTRCADLLIVLQTFHIWTEQKASQE